MLNKDMSKDILYLIILKYLLLFNICESRMSHRTDELI